jgi:hypothetical protein
MPSLRLILFLLFIPFFKIKAQQRNDWKELIVKVQDLSEVNVAKINLSLSSVKDLHFSGYIQSAGCLIIKYDPADPAYPAAILKTLEHFNGDCKVEVIEGFTVFEIVDGKME